MPTFKCADIFEFIKPDSKLNLIYDLLNEHGFTNNGFFERFDCRANPGGCCYPINEEDINEKIFNHEDIYVMRREYLNRMKERDPECIFSVQHNFYRDKYLELGLDLDDIRDLDNFQDFLDCIVDYLRIRIIEGTVFGFYSDSYGLTTESFDWRYYYYSPIDKEFAETFDEYEEVVRSRRIVTIPEILLLKESDIDDINPQIISCGYGTIEYKDLNDFLDFEKIKNFVILRWKKEYYEYVDKQRMEYYQRLRLK